MIKGFDAVPETYFDEATHRRIMAAAINRIQNGKMNLSFDLLIVAQQTLTTIKDSRISSFSVLVWQPLTQSALSEMPYLWVSEQGQGTASFSHSNSATSDRKFRVAFLG